MTCNYVLVVGGHHIVITDVNSLERNRAVSRLEQEESRSKIGGILSRSLSTAVLCKRNLYAEILPAWCWYITQMTALNAAKTSLGVAKVFSSHSTPISRCRFPSISRFSFISEVCTQFSSTTG